MLWIISHTVKISGSLGVISIIFGAFVIYIILKSRKKQKRQ